MNRLFDPVEPWKIALNVGLAIAYWFLLRVFLPSCGSSRASWSQTLTVIFLLHVCRAFQEPIDTICWSAGFAYYWYLVLTRNGSNKSWKRKLKSVLGKGITAIQQLALHRQTAEAFR